MSYKNLINTQVTRAFRLMKDLAVDVLYKAKPNSDFDFATGDKTPVVAVDKIVKTIVIDGVKSGPEKSTVVKQIMVKSIDLPNITAYDTIEYEGFTWQVGSVVQDTGYIKMISISRSV